MTMQPIIGWANSWIKSSPTLTYNFAQAGLLPSNLVSNDSGSSALAWQTTAGQTFASLTIDLAGLTWPLAAVAIARSNLTSAALGQVVLKTSSSGSVVYSWGGTTYGSPTGTMNPINGFWVLPLGSTMSGGWLRIGISDAANPDGFINIPILFAGDAWALARRPGFASTEGRDAQIDEIVTRGGNEFPQLRWQRRRVNLAFEAILASELANLRALDTAARTGGNVLYVPDINSSTINSDAILGRCVPAADYGAMMSGGGLYSWRANITERI